jgi:stress-induced-phosphoprotein 1
MSKAYGALNQVQNSQSREETEKLAQSNPEVQAVLGDPIMQQILQQMQTDPSAAREHMKNPMIAKKISVLVNAGIVKMG